MTIKELQEKLKEFDENLEVRTAVKSYDYDDVFLSGSIDEIYFNDEFNAVLLKEI